MQTTIILLSYNNYYNRIVKTPLQSASEYALNGATVIQQLQNVNFYENDGVSTSLDVLYAGSTHPDYLIVADEDGKVIQRWYVIDSIHVSGGQRKLSLLRDVIADHYSATVESPIFVEKAMLNAYDPAIFNDEGVSVNQILTRKELLTDQTGCPWIVGYIPKNFPEGDESVEFHFDFNPAPDETVDVEKDASFYLSLGEYVEENQKIIVGCVYKNSPGLNKVTSLYIESTQNQISPSFFYDESGYWSEGPSFGSYSVSGTNSTLYESAVGKMDGRFPGYISGYGREIKSLNINPMSTYSALMANIPGRKESEFDASILGKVIYISSTGEYKRVQRSIYTRRFSAEINANSGASWENLTRLFNRVDDFYLSNTMATSSLEMICDVCYSIYELVPFMSKGIATISQDRVKLNDQPYDMFCIPYSDDIYLEYNGLDLGKFRKDISMGFAQSISSALGSSTSYDIQILPYCPVPNLFGIEKGKKVMHFKERASSDIATELEEVQGGRIVTSAIFWASSSSFEFSIPWRVDVPTDPVELKLIEICDKYRMASPNMSSFFDFSPMKNGGVTSIDVVCSYRPYSPYIHLNPRFGGIYASSGVGYEVRGLDLSGNFSLTQTSNAWTDYQLQNKNFENIFNRQMDSLELQHKVQEKFEILNAFTGAVSGSMSGGMSGAAAGPVGTVAGMLVGGVASGVAGAMDVNINRMLRQEQVSLQEDIFAYQKGNIQALPNSLTKVDTLSQNNPLIPYIEFYTCTQIEREAIKNMIRFSGMTVGRIGKISEFTASGESRYIRGKLIRIEGIEEDFHIVQQISQEIQKGIYI